MGVFSKIKHNLRGQSKKQPNDGGGSVSTTVDIDPWTRAHKIVQEREGELMEAYWKHLEGDAAAGAHLSGRHSVETILNKLLQDRKREQWSFSILGKDVKIRQQVERLAKFILWSDPIVQKAVISQPYAALAWSGVSLLLSLLTRSTTQNEAMLKGFNSIVDRQMYWQICEQTYLQSEHRQYQRLIEPLAKLYSYMIEYQAQAVCHLSSSRLSRSWRIVSGSDDWAAKMGEIERMDETCRSCIGPLNAREIGKMMDIQLQEMQKSRFIQEDILQAIKDNRQDGREAQLLQDLAMAAGDYKRHKNINPERVAGTCEWFLTDKRFCKWRDSKSTNLLWVSAGPGRGKSVLSRSLIDEGQLSATATSITMTPSAILASTGTTSTVCYFFFRDGGDGDMDGAHALCAILHQLFTCPSTSGLIKHALPSHMQHGQTLTKKFYELWQMLVDCVRSSDAGDIICVLDALDECKEGSRREIIRTLGDFYSPNHGPWSKLKFLVTSRPYDDVEHCFRKLSENAAYLRFDGDDKSGQISREIDLVIDARMQDIAAGFRDEDRLRISERLKSMENRTYLWLHLTLGMIERRRSAFGKRANIEKVLSELPYEVSDAYEKILSRSQDHGQTGVLLQLVLAAQRPLTLDEANYALTLAFHEERFPSHAQLQQELWPRGEVKSMLQNLCGLFISVYDSKLAFIHQTAREFLVHAERRGTWQGRFNMAKAHSTISQACLHYLLLPDIEVPVQGRPNVDKNPFLFYSANNWRLHYVSQEESVADKSVEDACMLCNISGKAVRIWGPVYSNHVLKRKSDLTLAVYLGLRQVAEKLYVDASGEGGMAVQLASEWGHREIVEMLLQRGANVNARQDSGTALRRASARGYGDIVEMLLQRGADVEARGEFGTALQLASEWGRREVVEMLLQRGAQAKARRDSGTAPPVDGPGRPLPESSVVCSVLGDGGDGDDGAGLLPGDAYGQARARLWMDHVGTRIVPAFCRLLQHQPDRPYSLDEARAELQAQIRAMAEQMDPSGPWFLGRDFSLVDGSLVPWAKRLWLIDHYMPGGTGIPSEGGGGVWGRWRRWMEAMQERQREARDSA